MEICMWYEKVGYKIIGTFKTETIHKSIQPQQKFLASTMCQAMIWALRFQQWRQYSFFLPSGDLESKREKKSVNYMSDDYFGAELQGSSLTLWHFYWDLKEEKRLNWVKGQEELGGRASQGGSTEHSEGPRTESTECLQKTRPAHSAWNTEEGESPAGLSCWMPLMGQASWELKGVHWVWDTEVIGDFNKSNFSSLVGAESRLGWVRNE